MPSAKRRGPNERFDVLFRRWKRAVEKDGVLQTYRDKEFYEKPSAKRKKAKAAAVKRYKRSLAEQNGKGGKKGFQSNRK